MKETVKKDESIEHKVASRFVSTIFKYVYAPVYNKKEKKVNTLSKMLKEFYY